MQNNNVKWSILRSSLWTTTANCFEMLILQLLTEVEVNSTCYAQS